MMTLDEFYGILFGIACVLAIVVVFNFIVKKILKRLERHFKQKQQIWKESFVNALYTPLSCYVWFFAAIQTISLILLVDHHSEIFAPYKQLLLSIFAILAIAWFVFRWKKHAVTHLVAKSKLEEIAFDRGKIDVIDKVLTIVIIFFTILMLLEVSGRSLTALIAFGGVGGLAIAFASQEIIANFFGGLMIYTTHPFEIGDWVVLPDKGIEGHVEEIGWYMTRIRTFEKRPMYVPNSSFSKMVLENPSRMTHRQIKETVGVRYEDLNQIKPIIADIKQMLKTNPRIDRNLAIQVYLSAFGTSSLDIIVWAYTTVTVGEQFNIFKEEILFAIMEIVSKHEAELAYPTTRIELNAEKDNSFCST